MLRGERRALASELPLADRRGRSPWLVVLLSAKGRTVTVREEEALLAQRSLSVECGSLASSQVGLLPTACRGSSEAGLDHLTAPVLVGSAAECRSVLTSEVM